MKRRKPRRHVDISSSLYADWLHAAPRGPKSLVEVVTRSRRRNRASEKREKRQQRKGRGGR